MMSVTSSPSSSSVSRKVVVLGGFLDFGHLDLVDVGDRRLLGALGLGVRLFERNEFDPSAASGSASATGATGARAAAAASARVRDSAAIGTTSPV